MENKSLPYDKSKWDKNRGIQVESFSEALVRAQAAQEVDEKKEQKS